ncbi:sensor histidine kinase [Sphingorhabdus sp.]|uniref:sensor histidine kinase n=1 Tax=Sphingorhabdus sp. TaxID=1902408 RepID=UPI0039193206
MIAEAHIKQQERLAALRRYEILDTPFEREFDEVVDLASRICDTPISVINLIDVDRQWFKAEIGLGVRSTPLATSICSHVILENDFVEIEDTLEDPRTRYNPLCFDENGLRFYAGALLKTPDGLPIGTLCVLDHQPRTLTALQRDALRILADQVMRQLELRLALKRQEILRREMDHRVKNSLQTVNSIIGLQVSKSAEPAVKIALDAVKVRLTAIIAFHEELHQAGDGESIELATFLARLANLQSTICPAGVTVKSRVAQSRVSADTASLLGMIINEFVANALKHVYASFKGGEITITGTQAGSNYLVTCTDGGPEIHDVVAALSDAKGLGLRIIAASIEGLGAIPLWTTGEAGLRLSFAFKIA